jgi:hypothetical protein
MERWLSSNLNRIIALSKCLIRSQDIPRGAPFWLFLDERQAIAPFEKNIDGY